MIAVLATLWTGLTALLPPGPRDESNDRLLSPIRVVASREGEGDAFEPIAIDGSAASTPWRRARLTFVLPATIESGAWMLGVGRPGLALEARLADRALGSAPDALELDEQVRFGPRFTVAAEALAAGEVTFELRFGGKTGGVGLERGPAWLASPRVAQRAFDGAQSTDQAFGPVNFAAAATIAANEGAALERICFKWSAEEDSLRQSAQLDFAVVDRERGGETPARSLARRRAGAVFPTSFATFEDNRFRSLQTQFSITAGTATSPLRLSDAKVIAFEVSQTALRQAFQIHWNVRLLPGIGGPLKVTREKGLILLANERIGLAASAATLLGDESAPCGLQVELVSEGAVGAEGTPGASRPSSVRLAVLGYEPGGADPSQADSLLDLARSVILDWSEHQAAATLLANSIVAEPSVGSANTGLGPRKAGIAVLTGARRRGTRFMFAADGSASGPAAFWGDTFTLLHFPNHERGAVERLLATQDDAGAVRLDVAADAGEVALAATTSYAVLRACRWFRWTCDGDRFRKLLTALDRGLGFADGCDLAPGPAEGELTPLHAALVRAAAHRELAAAMDEIGAEPELAARHAATSEHQRDLLLGSNGRLDASGFGELVGGDARDAALALALGLADDVASAAIATQVAPGKRPYDPHDWRDALVARGLLTAGRVKALGRWIDGLDNGWRPLERPQGAGIASWHGVVAFGLLGVRRENLGTLELRPRLLEGQFLRSTIRLPEGPVRFNVTQTDRQLERQVIVINEAITDLMVRIGIPDGSNAGERRTVGDQLHAFHEEVLAPKATWRTRLR